MKSIGLHFDNDVYEVMKKAKGKETWTDFIVRLAMQEIKKQAKKKKK